MGPNIFCSLFPASDYGSENTTGALGLNLLYSPSETLVDFVFVHGLGGGSRKTWSKTKSIKHYWPQEWLPRDPAFKNVRVYSFGYDSNYFMGKDNCLDIHQFGKLLLSSMSTVPGLSDAHTPIVLIGHSMGGLVIKKMYLLARQDPIYQMLANRIHTIYFLATPHQGSSSAKLLSRVLRASYSNRAYVMDLRQHSPAIQSINDDFRHHSASLTLLSFYETQKLRMGIFSKMIVGPDSAILNYPGEKQTPMNADHRSICKFKRTSDPNYLVVRDTLASTIKIVDKTKKKLWRCQVEGLRKYFGMSGKSENDLAAAEDARLPGTCKWFAEKKTFREWKEFASESPPVLWVTGKPGAGKSILAGYVIDHLRENKADCSYFFFKQADGSEARLGAFLRSMAFQMACTSTQVRQALLEMQEGEMNFDKDNVRTIWQKLFMSGIFQTGFSNHYWIVDGLDECVGWPRFFDLVLGKLDGSIPLRILIMSRESTLLEKSFIALGPKRFQTERLSTTDTLPDIERLVKAKSNFLAGKNDDDRAVLAKRILEKSNGCILWTALVLEKFSKAPCSEEELDKALENVPQGMGAWYQSTLETMAQATHEKTVAHAILTWTTCATRPLTTGELQDALKLDINETFSQIEEAVAAFCGQLVIVDKSGKVQMVHETAREFLLNDEFQSDLAVKTRDAHTRIARTCLTYLTGDAMRPLRSGRRVSAATDARNRAGFSVYACEAFSYHLSKADPLANDVMLLLYEFLSVNVLSWIEVVARTQGLLALIRMADHLRSYHKAAAAERSPLGKELPLIRGWATDLIRVVAKFGDAITKSPSAIYSIVLPFCPTESTVYNVARSGRRISVLGHSNASWDDRIACMDFPQGQTSAVCHGDEFFAVGLTTGAISLYHATSFQEYKILKHGEAVRFLSFKDKSDLMASCGFKTILVWNVRTAQIIHDFKAPQRCISLLFFGHTLIAASQKNYLASWDLNNDGAQKPDRPWNDSDENRSTPLQCTPRAISISVTHKMLAIAYVGQPILLWNMATDSYYGTCGKKLSSGETTTHAVSDLVFNPHIDLGLLAVSYLDGELALLDPFADREIESLRANCHTLAASPNGRLLAGGAGSGIVQIYDFDTLTLRYRIKSSELHIKQIAFSRDDHHFADIRGSQCNIWEPALLLRDLVRDDSSEGTSVSVYDAVSQETKVKISVMLVRPMEEVLVCGKEDGSVYAYNSKTGSQLRMLYRHKSLVRILAWGPQDNTLMSIDASNGIFAWKMTKTAKAGWIAEELKFQSRLDCGRSIIQVLINETASKFILSTRESDHLWSIDGQQQFVRTYSKPMIRKWIQHPQSALHMICLDGSAARICAWSDWSEVAYVHFDSEIKKLQLKTVTPYKWNHKQLILLELSEQGGSSDTRGLQILDAASLSTSGVCLTNDTNESANAKKEVNDFVTIKEEVIVSPISSPLISSLAHCIVHVIGIRDPNKLIFLDTHSWVCSADLGDLGGRSVSYVRHFFVPYDWLCGTRDLKCAISKRNVVLARNDNVVIVQGGLEHMEMVESLDVQAGSLSDEKY
ncbi:NACHT and WD domain protein [Hyaloscypha variabilis F]|uniref:GPI inositol-deacylase n=1 Tax=Hyaloscypha variabilis (strain UAMH 11265 / GT02V1 / F) TaxID=1149755 RepID=A0A2J6RV08_HYAVF|nr:NACHT and WD domain protein [Hyaloscypha variabilis F]